MTRNRPSWFFDEEAHAGPDHLDSAYAAGYDAKSQTDPGPDLDLLGGLGLNQDSTVMDFGAGTGTFALAAALTCKSVIAVDVSAAMLAELRRRAGERGLDNIEVVNAGFLAYGHAGHSVDFAYSRNALHHLPDFWKTIALEHVSQTLRPGGVFLLRDIVYSFDPADATSAIEDFLARAATDPASGFTAAEWTVHLREEFSTYSWLLESMLARAGFDIRSADFSDSHIFARYTCVKR